MRMTVSSNARLWRHFFGKKIKSAHTTPSHSYARILNVGLAFLEPPNRTTDPGTMSCWRSVASGLVKIKHPSVDLRWTVPLGFMRSQVSG